MYDAASSNESAGPLFCLPQQFTFVYLGWQVQEGVLSRWDSACPWGHRIRDGSSQQHDLAKLQIQDRLCVG